MNTSEESWQRARRENEQKVKAKKAIPMPKTVNKPIEAAGAAAAVAIAKKAAAATKTGDAQTRADAGAVLAAVATTETIENVAELDSAAALEAAEARAAALLDSAAAELSAAEATVLKAEMAFKTSELDQPADTAAVVPPVAAAAGVMLNNDEKKIADMKVRARSLLLNSEDPRREAPAEGETATYVDDEPAAVAEMKTNSKVNPAMTPEEIAAFWADDISSPSLSSSSAAAGGSEDEDILLTPPELADIKETPFPNPGRRTNWMLVFATVLLWPLTVPFRALRLLVRLILWPLKKFSGGGAGGDN